MRSPHSYSTEAIVLKRTDLGEADRILTLFTPGKGKIRAVAKGTRRPISKMGGHLDLLCRSQLQLALGRNLDIVTQAEGRENFLHLRNDLWHMTCGFYLAELVDRFVEDSTQHYDIYALLLETLRYMDADANALQQLVGRDVIKDASIEANEGADANKDTHQDVINQEAINQDAINRVPTGQQQEGQTRLLLRYFELRLLMAVGYEPVLQNCASCASEIRPEENGFRASLGGVLCPQCSRLWERRLSLDALKALRYMQRVKWSEAARMRPDARLHSELEAVMYDLLRFHLERDLKSWDFLEMMRKA
jgi:DNA repair protein RecO (recombination protein O)